MKKLYQNEGRHHYLVRQPTRTTAVTFIQINSKKKSASAWRNDSTRQGGTTRKATKFVPIDSIRKPKNEFQTRIRCAVANHHNRSINSINSTTAAFPFLERALLYPRCACCCCVYLGVRDLLLRLNTRWMVLLLIVCFCLLFCVVMARANAVAC